MCGWAQRRGGRIVSGTPRVAQSGLDGAGGEHGLVCDILPPVRQTFKHYQ